MMLSPQASAAAPEAADSEEEPGEEPPGKHRLGKRGEKPGKKKKKVGINED
jgi:hypothetical protein